MKERRKKSEETNLAAQPSTLAAFPPWGSSTGACRLPLTATKIERITIRHNLSYVIWNINCQKVFHHGLLGYGALTDMGNLDTGCVNERWYACRAIDLSDKGLA